MSRLLSGAWTLRRKEGAKLPQGAVVVTAIKFDSGTAQELIKWQKHEEYNFLLIAIVDNLNAVDMVQRPTIDKQLVETVGRYARSENTLSSVMRDNCAIFQTVIKVISSLSIILMTKYEYGGYILRNILRL